VSLFNSFQWYYSLSLEKHIRAKENQSLTPKRAPSPLVNFQNGSWKTLRRVEAINETRICFSPSDFKFILLQIGREWGRRLASCQFTFYRQTGEKVSWAPFQGANSHVFIGGLLVYSQTLTSNHSTDKRKQESGESNRGQVKQTFCFNIHSAVKKKWDFPLPLWPTVKTY